MTDNKDITYAASILYTKINSATYVGCILG